MQLPSQKQHYGITIHHVAMMVSKEHTVCVPIKADAQLSLAGTHFGCHYFRVQRAAVFVDVASVGAATDGTHLGTIAPPEVPANCGWGDDGKTLYMTAATSVYRIRTLVGK